MIEELLRSYLLLLFCPTFSATKKMTIARDAIEVLSKKMKSLGKDARETVNYQKMELILEIASLYEKGVANINAVDKILLADKWSPFMDEVNRYRDTQCNDLELQHFEEQLILEKEYLNTCDTVQEMRSVIEKIDNREYGTIKEMQSAVEEVSGKLYMDFIRAKSLTDELDKSGTIDFTDPEALMETMFTFYDGRNYVSSGYRNVDELLGGGFECTRLYVFAGRPGSGKSTFLLNFMYRMGENVLHVPEFSDRYILYITLENMAMETTQRVLCKSSGIDTRECNRCLRTRDGEFRKKSIQTFKDLADKGMIIDYHPARTFSINDLIARIEHFNNKTGKKPLCVIVDYLDLMKLPAGTELRHQLGDATLGLKTIATQYKIPVLTATQLVKNAYEGKPTLGSIKESSEKIDHADAIALIHRTDSPDKPNEAVETTGYNVEMTFEKSRASANGILKFVMDLSKFNINEFDPSTAIAINNMKEKDLSAPSPVSGFQSPTSIMSGIAPVNNGFSSFDSVTDFSNDYGGLSI